MSLLKIEGGMVYDPANGIDQSARHLVIERIEPSIVQISVKVADGNQ